MPTIAQAIRAMTHQSMLTSNQRSSVGEAATPMMP
jgi:hypothetical protein